MEKTPYLILGVLDIDLKDNEKKLIYLNTILMTIFVIFVFFLGYFIENISATIEFKYIISFVIIVLIMLFFYSLSNYFFGKLFKTNKLLNLLLKDTLHELNIPLSVIKANTQMLISSENDEKKLKKYNRIQKAGDELYGLYEDIDYYIKKETKNEIREEFELSKFIHEEVDKFEILFPEVTIRKKLEKLNVFTDKRGLSKVIDNLLVNALKYNKNNNDIFIKLSYNNLVIQDRGVGISESELFLIFDRYYQGENGKQGYGIGLSIVKAFCDEYNIFINIDSDINIGTKISLDFKNIILKGWELEEKFRDNFNGFIAELKEKFIEFFSSQCRNYGYDLTKEDARSVAIDILDNLFVSEIDFNHKTEENILQMKIDGVFMGFLINKSLLYILENYTLFAQKSDNSSSLFMKKLIAHLRRFSQLFEDYITYNVDNSNKTINLGDNNYIYSKNNILDIFKNIKYKNIEFINFYQGYPIVHEGKIIDIDGEKVVFEVKNKLQEIAMKLEGKAYIIKNEFFNRYIKGDILYSNYSNNTIILNNFTYLLNLPAIQRKFPRIYPKILIIVKLLGDEQTSISGNLYDLSQNGMAFISEKNRGYYNGERVSIEFQLTSLDNKYTIKTAGEIVDIMKYMNSFRYCLEIFPDSENLTKIIKYIEVRKKEILDELRSEFGGSIV